MADEANKSGSPLRLLLGLFMVILLAGAALLAYLQIGPRIGSSQGHEETTAETKTPPGTTVAPWDQSFLVNLADTDPVYVYKVDIKFNIRYPEEPDKESVVKEEIITRKAQISDIINDILMQQHYADIMSKGPDNYRYEILRRVNSVLTRGEIHDIYIEGLAIPTR